MDDVPALLHHRHKHEAKNRRVLHILHTTSHSLHDSYLFASVTAKIWLRNSEIGTALTLNDACSSSVSCGANYDSLSHD